uniref:Putative transporter n=1 Tax=Talaromyces marneffei PM1 TaxID=1077442 RepID=A0A093UR42_TALMA
MDVTKRDSFERQASADTKAGSSPTTSSTEPDLSETFEDEVSRYVPDTELEKRLVWKLDLVLLPALWLMCGNAKPAGMQDALDLTNSRYAMLITIFFIAYVIVEVPSNLILMRVRPSWYLPGLMIAWGIVVAGMSQVKTYEGILVIRFFLGFIEAGFMPGVAFLMSCWYKKHEIGKRFSIFFTALCAAGAISGLLSGAIIAGLDGAHGMAGWRWLFLLEGILTIGVAIVCIFILPNYPSTSRHFTPEERHLAAIRILHDRKVHESQQTLKMNPLQALVAASIDPKTYFFIMLYLLDNGVATISYFIPTVLSSMGYTGILAQWMTVPIWVVATLFLVGVSLSSDRTQDRAWHITFGMAVAAVSGIIIVTVKHAATRYAFICFYMAGVYCAFPLIMIWTSEAIAFPDEKRAVAIALVNGIGDLAVLYGSRMWPSTDAPDYKPGFTAMIAMCGACAVISAVMPVIFRYLPKATTKAERATEVIQGREV